MRTIDDSSFNSVLQKRLADLQGRATNIKPENINMLPFDPFNSVNVETAVGPASEFRNVEWDDNAIVNSIRMGKIKSIIRFLKVNKSRYLFMEKIAISKFTYDYDRGYDVIGDDTNGVVAAGNRVVVSVPMPEGYDGRKAFPHYGLNASFGYFTLNKFARRMSSWINSLKEGVVGVEVFQNEDRIVFEFKLPKDNGTVTVPDINIEIYAWNTIL